MHTFRNRGTEFMKSPEMLQVAYASQKTRATYDRRRKVRNLCCSSGGDIVLVAVAVAVIGEAVETAVAESEECSASRGGRTERALRATSGVSAACSSSC